MKTIKFLASITLLVLLSLSCSSSDNSTPSCDDLFAATDAAEQAYLSDNTSQNSTPTKRLCKMKLPLAVIPMATLLLLYWL